MTSPEATQRVARAMNDPTRFHIYTYITESAEPVGVAELTDLLGLNHNAIRQHLAVLVDCDMVVEEPEVRTTPGRPRLLYTAREDAFAAFGDASKSYTRLARLLVEVVQTGEEPYVVGRRAGEMAQVKPTDVDGVARLLRELRVEGFAPSKAEQLVVLGRCPFAEVAAQGPGVVCELHRGLIDGYLGDVATLRVRDPHAAGCEIHLPARSD